MWFSLLGTPLAIMFVTVYSPSDCVGEPIING